MPVADIVRIALTGAGIIAFILMILYDADNTYSINRTFRSFFFIGSATLVLAALGMVIYTFYDNLYIDVFTIFGLIIFLSGLIWQFFSLFFALPFGKTYVNKSENVKLVDSGAYALCRHPGVLGFIAVFAGLCIASRDLFMLAAAVIWTAADLIHVALQDKVFFPAQIDGYNEYRKRTPFLIPTIKSVKAFRGMKK